LLFWGDAYQVDKPRRDAERLIHTLEWVQLGHTRIEELAPALRGAGLTATSKWKQCQADLSRPFRVEAPGPPVSQWRIVLSR